MLIPEFKLKLAGLRPGAEFVVLILPRFHEPDKLRSFFIDVFERDAALLFKRRRAVRHGRQHNLRHASGYIPALAVGDHGLIAVHGLLKDHVDIPAVIRGIYGEADGIRAFKLKLFRKAAAARGNGSGGEGLFIDARPVLGRILPVLLLRGAVEHEGDSGILRHVRGLIRPAPVLRDLYDDFTAAGILVRYLCAVGVLGIIDVIGLHLGKGRCAVLDRDDLRRVVAEVAAVGVEARELKAVVSPAPREDRFAVFKHDGRNGRAVRIARDVRSAIGVLLPFRLAEEHDRDGRELCAVVPLRQMRPYLFAGIAALKLRRIYDGALSAGIRLTQRAAGRGRGHEGRVCDGVHAAGLVKDLLRAGRVCQRFRLLTAVIIAGDIARILRDELFHHIVLIFKAVFIESVKVLFAEGALPEPVVYGEVPLVIAGDMLRLCAIGDAPQLKRDIGALGHRGLDVVPDLVDDERAAPAEAVGDARVHLVGLRGLILAVVILHHGGRDDILHLAKRDDIVFKLLLLAVRADDGKLINTVAHKLANGVIFGQSECHRDAAGFGGGRG